MAQSDSVYSAVFFINPSFVSMGRSSITDLQTSPLAPPHLHFLLFLSLHDAFIFYLNQLTMCLTVIISTISLHDTSLLLSVSSSPSFLPLSPHLSLLSIPIHSPAHVDLIPQSCRTDCSETSSVLWQADGGKEGGTQKERQMSETQIEVKNWIQGWLRSRNSQWLTGEHLPRTIQQLCWCIKNH